VNSTYEASNLRKKRKSILVAECHPDVIARQMVWIDETLTARAPASAQEQDKCSEIPSDLVRTIQIGKPQLSFDLN
jgi:hypothetical protein